ncbi:MAG: tetratricopeptide repeat protein, partial [Planctomycetia bacterium]
MSVLIVVTVLAWSQPQTASAWFGRWRGGFCGFGYRPWCGPVFAPRCYGGWGGWYGGTRYAWNDSVYVGGPFGGFFSGSVSSYVIGPRFCAPVGWYGFPCTYYPYPVGYGCWGYTPIVVSPFPASIAPVYGPAGVLPFMGLASNAAARPAATAAPAAAQAIAIRASNGAARLRAARLVAVGDRHLRTAVHEPAKLSAALDAYRRAATIAPDQADTFLRQAIVLTALERADDATRAVERAVAIDARLGDDTAAAVAAQERLPPDPVFGDRPDNAPTTLASRSTGLLARIFREQPAGEAPVGPAGANWIAARWSQQWRQGHHVNA